MALAETTLSTAVTIGAKEIVVAAATSISAGRLLQVDGEMMQVSKAYVPASTTVPVLRGVLGSTQAAHVASARVSHGDASDFSAPTGSLAPFAPAGRVRKVISYSAAATITPPKPGEDLTIVLNGTSVVALTIAVPTKDLDGCEILFLANGAAAHTLTFTGGLSGAGTGYTVITMNGTKPSGIRVVACNEVWIAPVAPAVSGTATNLLSGVS
jgi:hypothetical protein